ncbi:hypothetical protein [Albibacillus kandeliae]|uniref:hypothetical protein n=1 Tax=Albibacillus kandeliae TaxID=2174228 RepID=UPI000D69868E|nr:hypothetical protein [Albibacillus kandeliae]
MMSPVLRAYLMHAVAFGAGLVVAWFALTLAAPTVSRGEGGALLVLAAMVLVAALAGFGVYVAVLSNLLKARLGAGWLASGAGATVLLVALALFAIRGGWLTAMEALIVVLVMLFGIGGAAARRLLG